MARVVHDNIQQLMEQDGKKLIVRPAVDGREFFTLLQAKMIDDIAAISGETTLEGKAKRIVDIQMALMEFMASINEVMMKNGTDYATFKSERQKRVGTFSKRLVTDAVSQKVVAAKTNTDIVLEYAEEHEWPMMEIAHNEIGKSYLTIAEGEESWRNAVQNEENVSLIMKVINDKQEKS